MKKISLLFLSLVLSALAHADPKTTLLVQSVAIDVNGKPGTVYRVVQPDGTWGYTGTEGDMFDARVINQTDKPMSMHWHGVVLPNDQDGVPGVTQAGPIEPGAYQDFHYPLVQNGTYWMHTHYGFGEQQQLSAPMIMFDPKDRYKDAKNVTMFLNDYTNKSYADIEKKLKAGMTPTPTPLDPNAPQPKHSGVSMGGMGGKGGAPTLSDVNFEVLLTNYKTLANPDVIPVLPGQTVRLRIVDAAVGSNFHINLGKLEGSVIATDGHYVEPPVLGSTFDIAIAQRLDIIVTIPKEAKESFPILAQVEGTKYQTGLILAVPGAPALKLSQEAAMPIGPINGSQEKLFHAKEPLADRPATRKVLVTLDGSMKDYKWYINNQAWPNVKPIMVRKGDRVQLTLKNNTPMGHPMHLHEYFQVMSINGEKYANGPMRDTVYVPANGAAVIALDANNPGNWMFHCHILYHQANGMMTVMQYEGMPTAPIIKKAWGTKP
jgi:FtsP/CotA-like multicopper oxidase with cupredoxin domain